MIIKNIEVSAVSFFLSVFKQKHTVPKNCDTLLEFNEYFKNGELNVKLNLALIESEKRLSDYLNDIYNIRCKSEIHTHIKELRKTLIKALYKESKLQHGLTRFSLLYSNSETNNFLSEDQKNEVVMLLNQIKEKPNALAVFKHCVSITELFDNNRYKQYKNPSKTKGYDIEVKKEKSKKNKLKKAL